MPRSNADLVRHLFDLWNEQGLEASLEFADPDVVVVVGPDMSAEPDVYRGHDGARRYFRGFDGVVDDVRYAVDETFEVGDCVIARMRVTGRGTSSGIPVVLEAVTAFWLRAGKIFRIEAHPDLDSARQAVSASA